MDIYEIKETTLRNLNAIKKALEDGDEEDAMEFLDNMIDDFTDL